MTYEEDFISKDAIEAKIGERKFVLKVLLGEDYDRISSEFISITPNESVKVDVAKRNSAFLRECVVDAPYEENGKKFKELKPEERISLLQRLNPALRNKLLKKIHSMHGSESDVEKN